MNEAPALATAHAVVRVGAFSLRRLAVIRTVPGG